MTKLIQMAAEQSDWKKSPDILLIIATYNCAVTLRRCLDSYVEQSYPKKKLVVIDGGSTDGTVDIIKEYEPHIDYWISEPDEGIYDAWNKALACGLDADWYQFMGGDDHYKDECVLERVARVIFNLPLEVQLAYGITEMRCRDGHIEKRGTAWEVQTLLSMGIHPTDQVSMFYHKDIFLKYGTFDTCYQISGDYEHYLRFFRQVQACFMNDIVVTVHHEGGISSNPCYDWLHWREKRQAMIRHGLQYQKGFSYCYIGFVRYFKYILFRILGERRFMGLIRAIRFFSGGQRLYLSLSLKK